VKNGGTSGGKMLPAPSYQIYNFGKVVGGIAEFFLYRHPFQLLPGDLISLAVLFPFVEP